jgi:hypothetical protein
MTINWGTGGREGHTMTPRYAPPKKRRIARQFLDIDDDRGIGGIVILYRVVVVIIRGN